MASKSRHIRRNIFKLATVSVPGTMRRNWFSLLTPLYLGPQYNQLTRRLARDSKKIAVRKRQVIEALSEHCLGAR